MTEEEFNQAAKIVKKYGHVPLGMYKEKDKIFLDLNVIPQDIIEKYNLDSTDKIVEYYREKHNVDIIPIDASTQNYRTCICRCQK